MEAVLSDVVVIDLSRVLAGPYCTMILGDLGATVIKVEQPGKGDDTRHFGPPYIAGESAYYLGLNRNKQSILLDFSKPEGKERLLKLVSTATVLVENFRPGSLERQGLGYEALRTINPGLIYCSISGYGQTGPYALRPGYDFVAQAESGLMSVTGEIDGDPQRVGSPVGDVSAGVYACIAILSALRVREDLATDPRFATNPQRVRNRQELVPVLQEEFLHRSTEEWLPELRAAGIPCGPINTVSQIFHDPHIQARDFVWECEHPIAGRIKLSGSPIHLSETPTRLYKAPPLLGEDDDKV